MHNFFITGLPRTRSSWLANFFTIGNTYCFHELSNNHKGTLTLREELVSRKEGYIGISDSMLPFYYEPLAETLQEQRLVIVDRPFGDVVDSLTKWLRNTNTDMKSVVRILEKSSKRLHTIRDRYKHMQVYFRDLDKPEVVEKLWYYCVPGVEFDRERYEMLNRFKVEPIFNKWFDNLKKENIESMMGVS